jgi:cytoskeletal protein RodZ
MEDSSFQSPVNQFSYNSETQKKPKKFVYLIILLVVLGGFFLIRNFFGSNKEKQTPETTPTPTEYQFPTDTPVPSISPTAEIEKPTVAPTKSVNPVDQSTGLDRSTLSVEVQNGSGEAGAAGKGAEALKSFGYKIASMGNADNFDYQNATVKVKSTKSNYLALLKKDLGFSYTVGSASADLSSSFSADALVIIGK